MSIGPCVHPRCLDETGNRRLTTINMCMACRKHLTKQLGWLIEDYVILKRDLPKPTLRTLTRSRRVEYGHPSEWASDTARGIAASLNRIEDDAREDLGDPPTFGISTAREPQVVAAAYRYLTVNLDRIIDNNVDTATDLAETVHDIHGTVRRTLGYTRQVQPLPGAPCPRCDIAALVKTVGQVTCEECTAIWTDADFERLALILADAALDRLIEAYDTRATSS